MSSVVISGNTSGSITLNAPAVAGTTTLNLPATTGTVLNDATCGVCRAWVNFNGTGTVAIRASFNVSSITDNGTGDYTVNFTNAMPDANYSVSACVGDASTASSIIMLGTNSAGATPNFQTNSVDIFAQNNAQIFQDKSFMCLSVFR